MARKISFCLLMLSCAGCSSIIEGTSQEILVNTFPAGASCTLLRNGQAIATVSPTPGTALVRKTKFGINVVCNKTGYAQASAVDRSGSAAASVAGDLLFPGIGWAIDSASGADNKYDSPMNLTLAQETASPVATTEAGPAMKVAQAVPAGGTAPDASAQPVTPAALPAGYYVVAMPPGMTPVLSPNGIAQSGAGAPQAAPMLYYAVSPSPQASRVVAALEVAPKPAMPSSGAPAQASGASVSASATVADASGRGEMRLVRAYPPGSPDAMQAVPPTPVTIAAIPAAPAPPP
jgi:hypothetical protein